MWTAIYIYISTLACMHQTTPWSDRASAHTTPVQDQEGKGERLIGQHDGVEGELLGCHADPSRPPLPRRLPPLALARRPPPTAPLRRRYQRRCSPPLGLGHDEGQREEGGAGGAVAAERDHGVDAGGDDVDPLLHRRGGRAEQHLRHQEDVQRRCARRARRVRGGGQVRRAPPLLPPRLPLPLPRHLLPQPGRLPHQRPLSAAVAVAGHRGPPPGGHQRLRRRRPGAGLPAQPRREQALLRRGAAPALGLRPRPAVPLLRGRGSGTVHHRRGRTRRRRGQQQPK